MNEVVVEGVVTKVSRVELASGDALVRWTVRAPGPEGRHHALPVVWVGRPSSAPRPVEGDPVLVVGALQRRFYRARGVLQTSTEVRAVRVLRQPAGARRRRLLDTVAARLVR
jgi:hypothetical protein